MDAIIELSDVDVVRDRFKVLGGLSVRIEEGLTTVFMGGPGSGKSTLLKAAAGLLVPDAGRVLYRGKDFARLTRAEELEFRKRSAFVFQDAALWANQSIFDNLALPYRFHEHGASRNEVERRVRIAIDLVGFDGELQVRPAELSTGERRLVGLARALVLDPELIYLDEPAAALDEASAERVFDILAQLRARERSLIVVSGNSPFVSASADAVGVVRGGRMAAFGLYAEAVTWAETGLKAETGRLKPRGEEKAT
jgi:phospholipid/cholesterol/gamma-HCH transport system ATP-binding protein